MKNELLKSRFLFSIVILLTCMSLNLTAQSSTSSIEVVKQNNITEIKSTTQIVDLNIPTIIYPLDNSINIPIVPKFIIGTVQKADRYEMQIALDKNFSNVVSKPYWQFDSPLVQDSLEWFPSISRIEDFKNSTTYYWRIRVLVNNSGESSPWSNVNKYTTKQATSIINKGTILTPQNGALLPWLNVNFQWDKVESATWYQIQWNTNSNFDGYNYRWTPKDTPRLLADLKPISNYYWRIIVFNDNSISQFSNTVNFKTDKQITLSENEYEFDDGSYSENYPNSTELYWLIKPVNGQPITLTFLSFSTEYNSDFVTVYDGLNTSSPILGKFSGNEIPQPILSSSGSLLVQFRTDWLFTYPGWKVKYSTNNKNYSRIESGFNFKYDSYSFLNDNTLSNLASGLTELYKERKSELAYIWPFMKMLGRILFSANGNCYGMSASSIMYYHNPYLIPNPYKNTYQIEISNTQAIDNIAKYQRIQLPNIIGHYFDRFSIASEKEKYEKVITSFNNKNPLLVGMNALLDKDKKIGHAIVAYKIDEYKDSSKIYVYDVNFPGDTSHFITYYRGPNKEYFRAYQPTYGKTKYNFTKINFYNPEKDILPIDQLLSILKEEGKKYINQLIGSAVNIVTFHSLLGGSQKLLKGTASSSEYLYLEDQFGNKTGFYQSKLLNQIPGAVILDTISFSIQINNKFNYKIHYKSNTDELFDFSGIITNSFSTANCYSFDSLVVHPGTLITQEFNSKTISQASIDINGDGIVDIFKQPTTNVLVGIVNTKNNLPQKYFLNQNYPNPFNPETTINYQIPKAEFVTLKVYDMLGREVATLVNEFKQPGTYSAEFKTQSAGLASGMYFYTLHAGGFVQTKKMLLLK